MGGFGSGRTSGRGLVEDACSIDFPGMCRRGFIKDGESGRGRLEWIRGSDRCASIGYAYNLLDPTEAGLKLRFSRRRNDGTRHVISQLIRLTFTEPHYGGRRWWMICPFSGRRVAKLYLPHNGDSFASREVWQLAYRSQRLDERGEAFSRLFRLQRTLGCDEQWGAEPQRPQGMWRSTFARKFNRYLELDEQCAALMEVMLSDFRKRDPGNLCNQLHKRHINACHPIGPQLTGKVKQALASPAPTRNNDASAQIATG